MNPRHIIMLKNPFINQKIRDKGVLLFKDLGYIYIK